MIKKKKMELSLTKASMKRPIIGERGEVWLKVLISAEGRATQVVVVRSSGFGALDQAAIDAMKATIFKPYTENGVAQPAWATSWPRFT